MIREERLKRGIKVSDWWKNEREQLKERKGGWFDKVIKPMFKECINLSEKFKKEFYNFWQIEEL